MNRFRYGLVLLILFKFGGWVKEAFGQELPTDDAREVVVDFEEVEIGKPVPNWSERGVRIELDHAPKRSKAVGRITFFPHLGSGRKGVVNAMANEAIPIRVSFEHPIRKATLTLWGSTTSSAQAEAYDANGNSLGKSALERVPVREKPEARVPFFTLQLEGAGISFITVSGSKPGGYLAIDELAFVPE